jgi:hypothetical protein
LLSDIFHYATFWSRCQQSPWSALLCGSFDESLITSVAGRTLARSSVRFVQNEIGHLKNRFPIAVSLWFEYLRVAQKDLRPEVQSALQTSKQFYERRQLGW